MKSEQEEKKAQQEKEVRRALSSSGAGTMRKVLLDAASGETSIHPGLVPGISVEDTNAEFKTNKAVFISALGISLAILAWAVIAPDNLAQTGADMQVWVVQNFGWLFSILIMAAALFMFVVGYGPWGKIRLGADDSRPEFSTGSWISMLFAAGLGIGLIFYGPMEPLTHFLTPPPSLDVEAGTMGAVLPAIGQSVLHQASFAWALYALLGGALAYSSYRRGRLPLISSLFEPIFPGGKNRVTGQIIDIFAVLVTLFGTATSMGIGALQIRTGTSILTGKPIEGNGFVIVVMTILTVVFIFSAVSGVKKGIRFLSNTNMALVIALGAFVLFAGPTIFILDLIPGTFYTFFDNLPEMLSLSASQGEAESEFASAWTILYWAWWTSWSPFVGMFIAKISKGRTLREFVTVVIFVPAGISIIWYIILGGTATWQNLNGKGLEIEGAGENVMFDLLANMPFSSVTWVVVLIAVVIFFTTAADSATNVMASMSQQGRPLPSKGVTIIWGAALGAISIALLLAGGRNALSGLQSIMVTSALPFAIVLIGIMVAWAKDLRNDPYMIRHHYAQEAIDRGVHMGIDEHGDNFVFGTTQVAADQGAGADFDSQDPALVDWYIEAATGSIPVVEKKDQVAGQENKE